jgi:hypothetical protein
MNISKIPEKVKYDKVDAIIIIIVDALDAAMEIPLETIHTVLKS